MPPFSQADIGNALRASNDRDAKKLAEDAETINNVWKILNVTLELLADANRRGGSVSQSTATMFVAKKSLAILDVAGANKSSESGVKIATFMGSQFIATIELGKALEFANPKTAAVYISLKTAEKIVSVAGMGNIDKCQAALASLTVSAGVNTFTCVATGGALCILGAASFALEAMNAHAQCQLPTGRAYGND